MQYTRLFASCVCLTLLSVAVPAAAQGGGSPRARPKAATRPGAPESNRELGDHRFPLAVFVPSALSLSHFGIRAGVEYHSVPGFTRNLSFFDSQVERVELQTVNAGVQLPAAVCALRLWHSSWLGGCRTDTLARPGAGALSPHGR